MPPAHTQDSRRAWVIVGAAFAAMFATFGIAYSFGAFLDPMAEEFDASLGAASTIFALTSLTFFGLGALSGSALDRYGPRPVLLTGAVALGLGLVATSEAQSLWLALLTNGLGVGIAVACAYVPMVALVGGWFERRRTLALGIAVAGIGLGTLALAPLAAELIDATGWRDTYLIFGLSGAAVMVVCAVIVGPAPAVHDPAALTLRQAIADRDYRLLYLACLLIAIPLFVPFVHLPGYAEDRGTGDTAAAALVGIIGAASIVGRLTLGAVAARIGLLRTFQGCFAAMAGSFALWFVGGGYGVLVVFASVLGVGYGGFVALGPAVVADRFGTPRLGGLLGFLYTSAGIGSAIGVPLAGVVIDVTDGHDETIIGCLVLGTAAYAVVLAVGRGVRARTPT